MDFSRPQKCSSKIENSYFFTHKDPSVQIYNVSLDFEYISIYSAEEYANVLTWKSELQRKFLCLTTSLFRNALSDEISILRVPIQDNLTQNKLNQQPLLQFPTCSCIYLPLQTASKQ